MAYYYGTMQGSRRMVTRCGDRRSGIAATLATWGVGVRVTIDHDPATNSDTLALEVIPWRDASDADAPGREILRVALGSLTLQAADTVDAMEGRQ